MTLEDENKTLREAVGWVPLTCKDEQMTCRMPADETVVEVMLNDGTVCRSWFGSNIMEAGDWDFLPVHDDDEPDDKADSLAGRVVAWRAALSKPAALPDDFTSWPIVDGPAWETYSDTAEIVKPGPRQ